MFERTIRTRRGAIMGNVLTAGVGILLFLFGCIQMSVGMGSRLATLMVSGGRTSGLWSKPVLSFDDL